MSHFADKVLTCRDCNNQFVFTAGEQEFYSTRGFSEPSRCSDCRSARKTARGGSSSYGDSGGFSSRDNSGGARAGGTRQMFKVTCADCGQETEVPFEPRTGRPVYCRNCFDRHNGGRR